jgi:hypothetical protein
MPTRRRKPAAVEATFSEQVLEAIRRFGKGGSKSESFLAAITIGGQPITVPEPTTDPGLLFNDEAVDPTPVLPAGVDGTSPWAARADHGHQGVHSVRADGQPMIVGDAIFKAGTGIQLSQNGQEITWTNTGTGTGGGETGPVTRHEVQYFPLTGPTPTAFELAHLPVGDVAVYLAGFRRYKGVDYTQSGKVITFQSVITLVNGDRFVADYFWNEDEDDTEFHSPVAGTMGFAMERYQILASTPKTFTLLYTPIGDVAVYFAGLRKYKGVGLDYTQAGKTITFGSSITFNDGDRIHFDYFYVNDSGGS